MIAAIGLGALVGGVLGVLGGGGSVLAVPALVYGLGQPVGQAVPTSLLGVGIASAVGAIPKMRSGDVRWGVAALFGGAGIVMSFAGAWVNHRLPEQLVLGGFAVFMAAVGARMLRDSGVFDQPDREGDLRTRWLPVAVAGAGVGFLTGLFGVGGGFLIVPALVLILNLPMHVAIGTSLIVIVVNTVAGFAAHSGQTDIDLAAAAAFTAGALVTSLVGGRLGRRVNDQRLARWFAVLVIIMAGAVLLSVFMLDSRPLG